VLPDLLLTALGMGLLLGGGDVMVRGACSLAKRLDVSPLAIGLTVVAFGTSAPELAVNVAAAFRGNPAMSFGNIFGSNMANIGLIVAITALVKPLQIQNVIIRREVPMMLLATFVAAALGLGSWLGGSSDGFDRGDGLVLLMLFGVFAYYTIGDVLSQRGNGFNSVNGDAMEIPSYDLRLAIVLTFVGIAALVAGGAITVKAAEAVARGLGVSDEIIGLTLVAVGTSLPELSASLVATARGHADLAVGNVVGSNIFNLLLVLGTTATIGPVPVPAGGVGDVLVVIGLSALLWLTSMSQGNRIIRAEASLLLAVYVGYIALRAG
jgi:cation:H+ antiporter